MLPITPVTVIVYDPSGTLLVRDIVRVDVAWLFA